MFLYLEKKIKKNGQQKLIQCFNSITCSKNTTPDLDYTTTQGFKHCLWRLLPPSFDKTKTKCVKGSIPNSQHLPTAKQPSVAFMGQMESVAVKDLTFKTLYHFA